MPTHTDALSTVLLIIAVSALSLATVGALALVALEVSRRWRGSWVRGEASTYRFRMPVVREEADITAPGLVADPTDRYFALPRFEAQVAASDDP